MEELVWNNRSSMLPVIVSNPSPWDSRTLISFQNPTSVSTLMRSIPPPWDSRTLISFQNPTSFSTLMQSIPEHSCGNDDYRNILGFQQQLSISDSPILPNVIANQHPLHQVKEIPGQQIPGFLDKTSADSVLPSSGYITGWGYVSPIEIPASSSAVTNVQLMLPKPDHTIACLQQVGSSSCNDLMHCSCSCGRNQFINQQYTTESLDCIFFSHIDTKEKYLGMPPTNNTENNVIGDIKSMALSASVHPQKSSSSIVTSSTDLLQTNSYIIDKYQSSSQGLSDTLTDKSKTMKSKSKSKSKAKCDPKVRLRHNYSSSTSSSSFLAFDQVNPAGIEPDAEAIASMREMIYRAAAFRPVNIGREIFQKAKRKNVRISSDPQTVAARQRREKISDRIRILQRLVPGGAKMDTASMLDEAINYLKFLKAHIEALQSMNSNNNNKVNNMEINSLIGSRSTDL